MSREWATDIAAQRAPVPPDAAKGLETTVVSSLQRWIAPRTPGAANSHIRHFFPHTKLLCAPMSSTESTASSSACRQCTPFFLPHQLSTSQPPQPPPTTTHNCPQPPQPPTTNNAGQARRLRRHLLHVSRSDRLCRNVDAAQGAVRGHVEPAAAGGSVLS